MQYVYVVLLGYCMLKLQGLLVYGLKLPQDFIFGCSMFTVQEFNVLVLGFPTLYLLVRTV